MRGRGSKIASLCGLFYLRRDGLLLILGNVHANSRLNFTKLEGGDTSGIQDERFSMPAGPLYPAVPIARPKLVMGFRFPVAV